MNSNQPHILIVDHEEDRREMYALYLAGKGYRVSLARDGAEALEKTFGLMPDLILLDAWMPEISGWEVLDCLKSDARTNHIPVLVATGHPTAPSREGNGFVLMKSFQLEELGAEIAQRVNALAPTSLHQPVV